MSAPPPPTAAREGEAGEAALSERARLALAEDGGTLFLADWSEAAFLHYEVAPDLLARCVPHPLALHGGRAYISLVAFTMRRFRPAFGGRIAAGLLAPLATQRFLNLRAYVRGPKGPGIFFLREWLDHPLAVRLGPATYGLPYRNGRLDYRHGGEAVFGEVAADGVEGSFSARCEGAPRTAAPGSLDEFLLERYLAYTAAARRLLAFRVWHDPWIWRPLRTATDAMPDFLRAAVDEPWTATLRPVRAVFSEGARDVRMGWPRGA